jgi:hypothetical protein
MLRFQVPYTNVDPEVQPGHREYLSRRKHQPYTSRAKDIPQDSAPCMQRIGGAESTHPNIFDHSTMYRCDKSSCDKRYIRSIIGCRAKRRHVTKWPAGDAWDRSGRPSAPNAAREKGAAANRPVSLFSISIVAGCEQRANRLVRAHFSRAPRSRLKSEMLLFASCATTTRYIRITLSNITDYTAISLRRVANSKLNKG